jgi:hypothetical protein
MVLVVRVSELKTFSLMLAENQVITAHSTVGTDRCLIVNKVLDATPRPDEGLHEIIFITTS